MPLALMVLCGWGCGGAAPKTPAEAPDQPVPPGEPRAEVRLEVDLRPARDCEEAFDLSLYEDRGIELVAWDDARGTCEARVISVRYLSRHLDADQVRELARRHAAAIRPAPPTTPAPDASATSQPAQPKPR